MSIVITLNHELAANKKILRQLILRGAYQFRMNAAFFNPEDVIVASRNLAEAAEKHQDQLRLIVDLPGSKRRIGQLAHQVIHVKKFEKFLIQTGVENSDKRSVIPIPHADVIEHVMVGDILTIKDGKFRLLITSVHQDHHSFEVESLDHFKLHSRVGYGLMKKALPILPFPPSNLEYLRQLSPGAVHFVAISYADSPEMMRMIRKELEGAGLTGIKLIAKIETPNGIEQLSAIAEECEGIWFCRGDLLNFQRPEDLYQTEKQVLASVKDLPVPLFVAGEHLLGYITSGFPSRGELAHLGFLYENGISGIVLSDETVQSEDPIEVFLLAQKIERKYRQHPIHE